MSKMIPKFFESEFFVMEVFNWHLKDGAPEDVKKEFEDYMNNKDYKALADK